MAVSWMGIDGGGTALRVVVVDDDMHILAQSQGECANPSSIGHTEAEKRIRTLVRHTLEQARLSSVEAVGIGIAGASNEHAEAWLRACVQPVLPSADIVPSSDMEIALVGGTGRLDGILLLAGTGSVALGIHPDGQRLRVGGWGHLIGDEGGGYWIGTRALQVVTAWADGYLHTRTVLPTRILEHLQLGKPYDLIKWRYQLADQREVAALAPLVLDLAASEDTMAISIVADAAQHLVRMVRYIMQVLQLGAESIVFAGSLLTNDTLLRQRVRQNLSLSTSPMPLYAPVIGAALLAKLRVKKAHADRTDKSKLE